MPQRTLFDVPAESLTKPAKASPRKSSKNDERGCKFCPMDGAPGIKKIKGTMRGRAIWIVAQSPGPEENNQGKELVGDSGEWLWEELAKVGIERKDCDIQNAMRCFPADITEGTYDTFLKMRNPSKEELHCCSLYTEEAAAQHQAKQILVFGQVAAKQLLKTRSLPQQKIFYSEQLHAKVYLLDHPSFFIRGYGAGARLNTFRKILDQVAADRDHLANGGEAPAAYDYFSYLREQKYRLVTTLEQAQEAERIIRKYARKGRRIAVDIEADQFDDGYHVFACGFCPKPGLSFVFVWRHMELQDSEETAAVFAVAKRILEDGKIQKALHFGCSDDSELADREGVYMEGFTHDTNLSEYFRFSNNKAYGLDAISESRFPEFSGYKLVRVAEVMEAHRKEWQAANPDKKLPAVFRAGLEAQSKYIDRNHLLHLRHLSLDTLRLYNGADCDLTKRIEISNNKHVPQALMSLYIDLSYLLRAMEDKGPRLDYDQHDKLAMLYPLQEKVLKQELRDILAEAARKPANKEWANGFNPASPDQVKRALYKVLKLEFPFEGKPNTQKMTLLTLGREHVWPNKELAWRKVSKAQGSLQGYKRSADAHKGRLRTRWWATGTRTGRLSSGGEKNRKTSTLVNLQNIKKDPQVRNMCVADKQWRKFYKAAERIISQCPELLQYWEVCDKESAAAWKEHRAVKLVSPSQLVQEQIEWASRKLENWVRKNMPNLRTFLVMDYGQVEVRVAAQMANDKNLIADCQKSDIHTAVGVTMTGWDAERIKNDEATRTLTKNVHFGILFGISKKNLFAFVLAMSPMDMRGRITREQVEEAYDRYFERYSGIAAFIVSQRAFGKEHRYVETLFGMRQELNVTDDAENTDFLEDVEEDGDTKPRGSWWGNQAINGPVQGTAHQLMICALVNLVRQPEKYKILGIPPMEVHDALYFNVRVLDLVEAHNKGKYLLEKESLETVKSDFPDIKWKVPIVVDAKAGIRLGCQVKVSEKSTPGGFLLEWFRVCSKQMKDLDRELEEAAAA